MAERKNSWKLQGSILLGTGALALAGGTYFIVDAQSGEDRGSPDVSVDIADFTPTTTVTPLVFESRTPKITPTETSAPGSFEMFTETPFIPLATNQNFTRQPTPTLRPLVWTPTPYIPTFAPTPEQTPWPTPAPFPEIPMEEWENTLFNLINQFRAENGVGSLNRNAVLDQSTRQYAQYLIDNNLIFEEHIHDLKGSPLDRANAISDVWFYVGEVEAHNSVYGGSPQVMVEWWKNSPGHRNALLSFPNPNPDERITEFGVGCAWGNYRFPDNTENPYVVCNGALGILGPTPTPAVIQ